MLIIMKYLKLIALLFVASSCATSTWVPQHAEVVGVGYNPDNYYPYTITLRTDYVYDDNITISTHEKYELGDTVHWKAKIKLGVKL